MRQHEEYWQLVESTIHYISYIFFNDHWLLGLVAEIYAPYYGTFLHTKNNVVFSRVITSSVTVPLSASKVYIPDIAWRVPVFGVILVRIFPHSDWIRRDTAYLCPSLRTQSKWVQVLTRITPNTGAFSAVRLIRII